MKPVLQTINNRQGRPEYVLLPVFVYKKLQSVIDSVLPDENEDYVEFDPANFIKNPIALRRMSAHVTQTELAKQLNLSQAYISKIEQDDYDLTQATLSKLSKAIEQCAEKKRR